MKIKIGKYDITDWEVSQFEDNPKTNLRVCDDGLTIFGIYIHNDNGKWSLIIYDDLLMNSYKSMFPNCMEFKTLEDGKAKVDLFLDKLQKLKAFL